MSLTKKTQHNDAEEKTIGSSVAPVARIGRRLQVAARVLRALEQPPREATLVQVIKGGSPVLRAVGEKLVVGRGAAADWAVEDPALSRLHFELARGESGCVMRDQKSHNGTRVNDAVCTERWLADGDLIQAGKQTFLFLAGTDTALAE